MRGQRLGGYVLAVGLFTGITLSMLQVDRFWIGQALLAASVVTEISDGITRPVLCRRLG